MAVVDPFHGLIEGVLQGHAIAQHLRNTAMQEEAFQRQKESQDREAQMQDIQAQMQLSAAGRPVTGNMVEQSFDAPGPDNGVPGVDRTSQTVRFSRPADKSRLLSYKTKDGRTIQSEAYTPEEFARRQQEQGMQAKRGGAFFDQQTGDMMHDYELATRGVPLPDDIAEANGYPRGSKVLPAELEKLSANASNVRKNNRADVAPGASMVDFSPQRSSPFGGNAPMVGAKPDAGPVMPEMTTPGYQSRYGSAFDVEGQGPNAGYPQEGSDYNPALLGPTQGPPLNPIVAAAQKAKDGEARAQSQARVLFSNPAAEKNDPNQTEANLAWTAAHDPNPLVRSQANEALKRLDQSRREGRPITNNMFTPPTGAATAGKATIDQVPAEFRDQVQQVLDYRSALPANSVRNPRNQAINYWVARVGAPDPEHGTAGYSAGEFANRNALMRSFEVGEDSKSIVALNTMINHVGTMWDGAEKLDNSSFKKYNGFANWLKAQGGSDQAKPFQVARLGVAEELSKLLKGGVATKDEVDHWLSLIDSSDSPAQLKTTVKTVLEMAKGRTTSLEEKYTEGMGRAPAHPFVRDRAQKVVDRINGGAQGGAVPDAVKAVLKGAGPGVHTLSDGTKWMTAADGTITKQ